MKVPIHFLVRTLPGWSKAVSLHGLSSAHVQGREGESPLNLPGQDPSLRTSSNPNYFPVALSPNATKLGVRASTTFDLQHLPSPLRFSVPVYQGDSAKPDGEAPVSTLTLHSPGHSLDNEVISLFSSIVTHSFDKSK